MNTHALMWQIHDHIHNNISVPPSKCEQTPTMGVKWFTSFIKHSSYQWEQCQPRGIVIDGLNFLYYHQLSEKISWKEGGRYWLLRETLKEFVECLRSYHIEPIVVINGFNLQKLVSSGTIGSVSMIEERKQNSQVIAKWVIHNKLVPPNNVADTPLPVLCYKVFLMAMEEIDVPVIRYTAGDTDKGIVAIANYYNYAVLAKKSDYYMYDIKAGYIPLDCFNWRTQPFKLEVYKLCEFNRQFGLADPQLSRVIPAVLGNNLITTDLMDRLIEEGVISTDNYCQVGSLIRFISKVSNVEQLISHIRETMDRGVEIAEALRAHIYQAEEMYDGIEPLSMEELQARTLVVPDSVSSVVQGFLNRLIKHNDEGRFLVSVTLKGRFLPRCVIDDPHKPTARLASVGIRQSMYTMMSPLMKENRVVEIMRNQLRTGGNIEDIEMVDDEVPILFLSPALPSVLDIEGMSPDEKLSVFCHVLGIDRNILEVFDNQWKLIIAAACYWVKKCRPSEVLMKSLAATFVHYFEQRSVHSTNPGILSSRISSQCQLDALHSFACFQCIYIDTVTLNKLLQGCLDATLSPAFFFDGKFALTCACTNTLDSMIEEQIAQDPLYIEIFTTLLRLS